MVASVEERLDGHAPELVGKGLRAVGLDEVDSSSTDADRRVDDESAAVFPQQPGVSLIEREQVIARDQLHVLVPQDVVRLVARLGIRGTFSSSASEKGVTYVSKIAPLARFGFDELGHFIRDGSPARLNVETVAFIFSRQVQHSLIHDQIAGIEKHTEPA